MKLWIDDMRPAPKGYIWIKTVKTARLQIEACELSGRKIEVIDIDHDAGKYAQFGGDYIKLLDWLEQTYRNYPIRIHYMNPVCVTNMRAIIQRNGWEEVK